MATSYVDFQGKGFWARDSVLEGWMCVAVLKLRRHEHPDPWEREVEQEWSFYVGAAIMGAVDLRLDHFLTAATHKSRMLALVDAVCRRLLQWGATVPEDELNALLSPENRWLQAPHTEWFIAVGRQIEALVEGRLRTNTASPTDYL